MFLHDVDFKVGAVNDLMKALEAGYETDAAAMAGGRALIPQDIEKTLVHALTFKRQDFKLMNLLKKQPVTSTIHEYTRREDVGDERLIFVGEGEDSIETSQTLARITMPMKYMQTYRKLTLQMRAATTLEDAEASEKEAGTLTILKGCELGCFHGDKDAVPEQFDSIQNQILAAATTKQNIVDLRGKDMTAADGENAISDLARMIYEAGGYATHAFTPPVISRDIQDLIKDRLRTNPNDRLGSMVIEAYPTPFSGDILVAGEAAGPDKFFRVKALPVTIGDEPPGAPTMALLAKAKTAGACGFTAETAGTYYYQVFAISKTGISAGCVAASAAPTAGQMVEITITPHADDDQTGYIVCRSKKDAADGTDCREMYKVATSATAATDVITNDVDEWLPGTGELVMVSEDSMQPAAQWDQFMPLMKFDLFPTNAAIIPFLIVLFGALDIKVPWYHGMVKNVGYRTMNWF